MDQDRRRARRAEREEVAWRRAAEDARVAEQSDSAVGDGLRLSFVFRPRKFFVEVVDIYETIFFEAEARFGLQDPSNGFINARCRKCGRTLRLVRARPWPHPEPAA